jgi:hypothetical protein
MIIYLRRLGDLELLFRRGREMAGRGWGLGRYEEENEDAEEKKNV